MLSTTFAPSGRLLSPDDIASAAVYFLSDEAALINGAVLDLEQYPIIGRNPTKGNLWNTFVKPRLAAFPKCFMDAAVRPSHHDRSSNGSNLPPRSVSTDWNSIPAFCEDDEAFLKKVKDALERHNLAMPMLCCSPDFTQPDPVLLQTEIEREKRMIELTAFFGGRFCRVLSGQRRPGLTPENGVAQVVRVIKSLLPFAEQHGVVLTMENHYKDNYWEYPEFAQKMDVFTKIVDQIDSPWFGVNFDPSNTILAGEDPLVLLERVKHRVVTMHASDRYLKSGTIEDLRRRKTRSATPAVSPTA